jgi:hypothetical protein
MSITAARLAAGSEQTGCGQRFLHLVEVRSAVGAAIEVRRVGPRQRRRDHLRGYGEEKRVDLFGSL